MYELGKKSKDSTTKEGWMDIQKGLSVSPVPPSDTAGSRIESRMIEDEIDLIMQDLEAIELKQSLFTWTSALDFEHYHSSWLSLASTAPSNNGRLFI